MKSLELSINFVSWHEIHKQTDNLIRLLHRRYKTAVENGDESPEMFNRHLKHIKEKIYDAEY